VARSIFQHAAELQADLVVLSTHGRMGLREWIFGSIAQKVLRRGAAPVFMLQPTPAGAAPEFRPERAVVYLEGTAADQAVLAAAEGLAAQCGTSLHLLMCVPTRDTLAAQHAPTGTLLPTAMAAVLDLAERGAAEQLQTYVTHLQDRQIAASAQVVRGDALQKLIETARQRSTDLICLTTHGESGLAALGTEEVAPKILPKFNGAFLLIRAEE
jgi:nucleotide-binding universal stress UspA family protein